LETENCDENEGNFEYWLHRETFYRHEEARLDREYRDRWINDSGYRRREEDHAEKESRLRKWFRDHLETKLFKKMPPKPQFEDLSYLLTTPSESWTASTPKTTATQHRPVDIHATSSTNVNIGGRGLNGIWRAVASTTNKGEGNDRLRRKRKNAYRANAEARSLAQCQPNG
jgi:hypothetical protein